MSSFDVANAVIVINEGTATETTLKVNDPAFALLDAEASLTVSAQSQKLSLRGLDRTGLYWRRITFGATATLYLQGTAVFYGTVVTTRLDVAGTGVIIEVECVGRTALLYSKKVTADTTYDNQTTGTIVADLIADYFAGTLTGTNVTTATGITVTEFTVSEGENIGAAIERLAKLDGYSFFVDVNDDVHYYAVSGTSQATIYESDLIGDAGEHMLESGVTPPKNVVRVRGGSGYLAKTKQESRDSYYTLDSTSEFVAQRFQATETRLSGVSVYANYTTGTNQPGAMTFAIYKDAYNEAPSGSLTTSTSGAGSVTISNASNAKDGSDATNCTLAYVAGNVPAVQFNFDMSSAKTVRGWRVKYTGPTSGVRTMAWTLYYSDDGASYTSADTVSHVGDGVGSYEQLRFFADSSHRYWRFTVTHDDTAGPTYTVAELELLTNASGTTYNRYPAYNSAGTHKVSWSDDLSFTASTLPNPAGWTAVQTYDGSAEDETQRKLQLTDNTHYWLLWKASADATASKYWQIGYYAASSAYSGGEARVTTNSGTTWSALNYDLTFRLYWLSGEVDVLDSDAASIAAYGEWYHEEVLPELTSNEEAQYVADAILSRYAAPGERMTLPLNRVRPELTPKQKVTVVRPLLDMNETATIVEIRHTIRPQRANTTIVTGVLPYNGARAVEELRKVV